MVLVMGLVSPGRSMGLSIKTGQTHEPANKGLAAIHNRVVQNKKGLC